MRVLVVNAGSSSLKLRLMDGGEHGTHVAAGCDIDRWEGGDETPIAEFVAGLSGGVDVVGHRVVHGGSRFTGPVLVDPTTRAEIAALADLAPLHQPRAVAAIDAAGAVLPGVPAVACFDTAFHAAMPAKAATYALPARWRERWELRRYGFHGLSHAYVYRRAAELVGRPPETLRVVSCHLGAGASLTAVQGGQSMDTTMGFTPVSGLVMATRSGSVDPGLVLWLVERAGLDAAQVSRALEHESGLAGLTGVAGGDMRDVRRAARGGDGRAALGLAVYLHRLRREIAAMCAAMDGMDVLAFTGGVGEHDVELRAETLAGLGFLGAAIDPERNGGAHGDADVTAAGARVRTVVVTAREEVEISRQTRTVLSGRRPVP